MVSINYHTTAETLTRAFFLCFEIFSETGMFPTTLEVDDATLVKFDEKDARRCVQGQPVGRDDHPQGLRALRVTGSHQPCDGYQPTPA